jgi:hypothetical protein
MQNLSTQTDSSKCGWEAPRVTELSLRETRSDDGGNSDTVGGGIFIFDEPAKPPKGKLSISADDRARVVDFLRAISSSPEKFEAAVFRPDEAMAKVGLTKAQIRIAKGVFGHLAR